MKKISLLIITVILNSTLFSCTPNSLGIENIHQEQATGDEDGDIVPPPPTKDNGGV